MERLEKKVCDLFAARFGAELQIRWLKTDTIDGDRVKNWQTSFVYSRTRRQVSFPIFNPDKKLQAIAIAAPVGNDDAVNFKDMESFIQLTIAESVNLADRYLKVERSEEAFNFTHNQTNNVVRWPKKETGANRFEITSSPAITKGVQRPETHEPIWIYGRDPSFIARLAVDAHEWIKNWAFFNVKEIPDLFWQTTEPWSKLVQTTIFIPEVETLSREQWDILQTNLKELKQQTGEKPLIILGSQQAPHDINPDLRWFFKTYQYHDATNARSQAHFLLFQHSQEKPWEYKSKFLKGLSFLPFSRQSDLLH